MLNIQKAHYILEEMVMNGQIVEPTDFFGDGQSASGKNCFKETDRGQGGHHLKHGGKKSVVGGQRLYARFADEEQKHPHEGQPERRKQDDPAGQGDAVGSAGDTAIHRSKASRASSRSSSASRIQVATSRAIGSRSC